MSELATWLLGLAKKILAALWDFVLDVLIAVLDLFLTAIGAIIQALPLPDFITGGLQSMINGVPSEVWFFASHLRLGECFAMFGAAVAFRLARKAATLGQW